MLGACWVAQLAVVVVGFPVTGLLTTRCRFCISASHTREDLDDALEKIEGIVDKLGLRYCEHLVHGGADHRSCCGHQPTFPTNCNNA